MATVKTRSDALGIYLSDPEGLGGARSALEFSGLEALISQPLPPLVIERVSPACGEGRGVLLATGGSLVSFQAPGDDAGAAVEVALNTRVLLESDDPTKSVRVFRDGEYSDAAMEGAMYLDLVSGMGNAIGIADLTTAGATQYGCIWLVNQSATPISALTVTGGSGYSVALEWPNGGVVQTIANATTAPIGVTFAGDATVPVLWPGDSVAVWLRRVVGATTVNAEASGSITVDWNWSALAYSDVLAGRYRIADASLARYELYVGTNALPDFSAPVATSATLPFSYALDPDALYFWCVRRRNAYDLDGLNVACIELVIGAGGADETPVLTDAEVVSFVAAAGGKARLRLRYNSSADATAADTWRLYITTDGSDPDPESDEAADTTMVQAGLARPSLEQLIDLGPYAYAAVVKIVARVYSSTLEAESTSVAVHSLTITTQSPVGAHLLGVALGDYQSAVAVVSEGVTYYNGPTNTVGLRVRSGELVFFSGATEVLRSERASLARSRLALALKNVTHSAAGAATPVEVVSADEIYLNVNGVRRCKIDLINGRIEAAAFSQVAALDVPVIGPVHITSAATYLQVRDRYTGRWSPALMVSSDGRVTFTAPIYQEMA